MLDAPSVAAMVATTGSDYFQYPGCVKLQRHRDQNKMSVEVIGQFGNMFGERLRLYHARNQGMLPEVLIVYRDGVADGMFGIVSDNEIVQMQQRCKSIYPGGKLPKIVFIIVQKRHHTRFFQPDSGASNGFDKNGNVQPGFVVDRTIISNKYWDFYLSSHKCIQGTSRPAHYVVIHDEYGLSADEIQLLTHSSCFLFSRATKSISVHPAARYADMLCDRARLYLKPVYNCNVAPGEERPTYSPAQHTHWSGQIGNDIKDTMFFI